MKNTIYVVYCNIYQTSARKTGDGYLSVTLQQTREQFGLIEGVLSKKEANTACSFGGYPYTAISIWMRIYIASPLN